MKNFYFTAAIFICISTLNASTRFMLDEQKYIMANETELARKLLNVTNEPHFNKYTELARQISNEKMSVLAVRRQVALAVHDYNKSLKIPATSQQMNRIKEDIITSILQDYPSAIIENEEIKYNYKA